MPVKVTRPPTLRARHEDSTKLHEVIEFALDRRAQYDGETMSVQALANASGLPSSRVTAAITGTRLPTKDELNLLAMALGISTEERKFLQTVRQRELSLMRIERQSRKLSPALAEMLEDFPDDVPSAPLRPYGRGRRAPLPDLPQAGQPDPLPISTEEELVQGLKAVLTWGGNPSLRELEQRDPRLRRSTVSEMLRRGTLPKYELYVSFLQACGISKPRINEWVYAWRRLQALKESGRDR